MKPSMNFTAGLGVFLLLMAMGNVAQEPNRQSYNNTCIDGDCLLCCLQRPVDDPFVLHLIRVYDLQDLGYAWSNEEKGLSLSFDDGLINRLVIYPGFKAIPPMGMAVSMSKSDCESLLGVSALGWDKGYRTIVNDHTQIIAAYHDKRCKNLEYISFDPLEGYEPPSKCYTQNILEDDTPESVAPILSDPCGSGQSECMLCYLTRSREDANVQAFIENYALKEGFISSFLTNNEKGIEISFSKVMTYIRLFPENFRESLPLIGSAETMPQDLLKRYPDGEVDSRNFSFKYKDLIKVEVYYNEQIDHIKEVTYSVLPFMVFSDECLLKGFESMIDANQEAIWKNKLALDVESVFTLCEYDKNYAKEYEIISFGAGSIGNGLYVNKLYSGLSKEEAEQKIELLKTVLARVHHGLDIGLSEKMDKIFSPQTGREISILTEGDDIRATTFSCTYWVSMYESRFADFKDNSINLLLNPTSDNTYDLLLVILF